MSVPSEGDHGSWRTFCFGGDAADAPPRQPTMPVLMAIDQVPCLPPPPVWGPDVKTSSRCVVYEQPSQK